MSQKNLDNFIQLKYSLQWTPVCDNVERQSTNQNIQYFIGSEKLFEVCYT